MGFDYVKDRVDKVIAQICNQAGGTEPPAIYLTGKNNFRDSIAKRREYKKGRPPDKPFHYKNIKGYLIHEYGAVVVDGMEADDILCIEQTTALAERRETIICSRDKDLKQCQGWHYSWECGKQPSFGPFKVDGYGEIKLKEGNSKKLIGYGPKWFLAQTLMGDTTDSIPGIKGYGPVKTYSLLEPSTDYRDGLAVVIRCYQEAYGDNWEAELEEQGQLVWMVKEVDGDGKPIMWDFYYE
jgi:5'-3' exonuclease